MAAHWLAGLNWSVAAVFSAIVLATGPTVVTPLVRQMRLASPLGDILEAEGLVLEPIGAVLALLLLELVLGDLHGWRELVVAAAPPWRRGVDRCRCRLVALGDAAPIETGSGDGAAAAAHSGDAVLMYGVSEWLLPESALPASVAAGIVGPTAGHKHS